MKAEHLSLHFGALPIYDDCSFHFEDTDKVGVVGVNGAGKSTLFKVILGQEKLDEGQIKLPGLRLGYLPQEIKIDPKHDDVTVWEYIAAARPVDEFAGDGVEDETGIARFEEHRVFFLPDFWRKRRHGAFDRGRLDG